MKTRKKIEISIQQYNQSLNESTKDEEIRMKKQK